MGWTDITFVASSLLTSTKMTQFYDNVIFRGKEYRNLIIQVASTSGRTFSTRADYLILTDSSSDQVIVRDVANITDISTSGQASALDSGTAQNTTFYSLWTIHDSSVNTTSGLVSHSFTSPILPSGYTYKKFISYFLTGVSAGVIDFYQTDDIYIITNAGNEPAIGSDVDVAAIGSLSPTNIGSVIPLDTVVAHYVEILWRVRVNSGGNSFRLRTKPNSSILPLDLEITFPNFATNSQAFVGLVSVPVGSLSVTHASATPALMKVDFRANKLGLNI